MIDADRCGKARRSNVKEHKLPWPHGKSMATRQLVGQCLEVAQPFYVYQRQPELVFINLRLSPWRAFLVNMGPSMTMWLEILVVVELVR